MFLRTVGLHLQCSF